VLRSEEAQMARDVSDLINEVNADTDERSGQTSVHRALYTLEDSNQDNVERLQETASNLLALVEREAEIHVRQSELVRRVYDKNVGALWQLVERKNTSTAADDHDPIVQQLNAKFGVEEINEDEDSTADTSEAWARKLARVEASKKVLTLKIRAVEEELQRMRTAAEARLKAMNRQVKQTERVRAKIQARSLKEAEDSDRKARAATQRFESLAKEKRTLENRMDRHIREEAMWEDVRARYEPFLPEEARREALVLDAQVEEEGVPQELVRLLITELERDRQLYGWFDTPNKARPLNRSKTT